MPQKTIAMNRTNKTTAFFWLGTSLVALIPKANHGQPTKGSTIIQD